MTHFGPLDSLPGSPSSTPTRHDRTENVVIRINPSDHGGVSAGSFEVNVPGAYGFIVRSIPEGSGQVFFYPGESVPTAHPLPTVLDYSEQLLSGMFKAIPSGSGHIAWTEIETGEIVIELVMQPITGVVEQRAHDAQTEQALRHFTGKSVGAGNALNLLTLTARAHNRWWDDIAGATRYGLDGSAQRSALFLDGVVYSDQTFTVEAKLWADFGTTSVGSSETLAAATAVAAGAGYACWLGAPVWLVLAGQYARCRIPQNGIYVKLTNTAGVTATINGWSGWTSR